MRSSYGGDDRLLKRYGVTVMRVSDSCLLGGACITKDLPEYLRAPRFRMLKLLENKYSSSLTQDEAGTLTIVRA